MSSMLSSNETDSDDDEKVTKILEIDLDSLESAQSILTARRTTTSYARHGQQIQPKNLSVAASIYHDTGNGRDGVVHLITHPSDSTSLSPKERWLHYATECISFEQFKRNAINTALQHHPDCVPIVIHLLNNIQDKYEHRSAYGSYIEPGTVLRCDGTERRQPHTPDLSVTFISSPYFDISRTTPLDVLEDESLHVTRSLFQHYYPQEDTRDRDGSQQFRKFRRVRNGQFLRVPQMWALILNSTTIISCGPSSLLDTAKGALEIVPEDSLVGISQRLIHVTDFHKRVTILAREKCGTYLHLRQVIQEDCLSKTSEGIDQCNLHLGDSELTLEPSLWPSILKDTQTAFVYIRISRKKDATKATNTEAAYIEAPVPQKMIEYTDLSSDEDSIRGKELALYHGEILQTSTAPAPSDPTRSSRKHLEDQGYVVNNEQSLQAKDVNLFPGGQPKIFRRPTVIEAEEAEADDIHASDSASAGSAPHSDNIVKIERSSEVEDVHHAMQTSDGRRVRFQSTRSDHERGTESASLCSSVHSYDHAHSSSGSEDELAGNTLSWDLHEPGPSQIITHQSAEASSNDRLLLQWDNPLKSARAASNRRLQAEVEDYESLASSGENGSHEEQSDVPAVNHDTDLPASDPQAQRDTGSNLTSLDQSSILGDKTDVSNEGADTDHAGPVTTGEPTVQNLTTKALRTVIKDEVMAALQESRDEKHLEHAMRSRLAQFGFQENQIQAMVYPEQQKKLEQQPGLTPLNPLRIAPQPTYAKIMRKYLDIETLHYYEIPFEYDVDPNYIVLLREMSDKEVDILFEHTRRLRSRKEESFDAYVLNHRDKKVDASPRIVSRSRTPPRSRMRSPTPSRSRSRGPSRSKLTDTNANDVHSVHTPTPDSRRQDDSFSPSNTKFNANLLVVFDIWNFFGSISGSSLFLKGCGPCQKRCDMQIRVEFGV